MERKIGMGWRMTAGFSFSTNKDNISNEFQNENNEKQIVTNPGLFAFKNFDVMTYGSYVNGKSSWKKSLKD